MRYVVDYKVIDEDKKIVRFYLGNAENAKNSWGDDWNDYGDKDNVYSKYVDAIKDVQCPKGYNIVEIQDVFESVTKADLKQGLVPCVVFLPEEADTWRGEFILGNRTAKRFYFGDEMQGDEFFPEYKEEDDYWERDKNAFRRG